MLEQLTHVSMYTVLGWIMHIVTVAFLATVGWQLLRRRIRAHSETTRIRARKAYDVQIRRGQVLVTLGVLLFSLRGTIVDDKVNEFMGNEYQLMLWLAFVPTVFGLTYLFGGLSNRRIERKNALQEEVEETTTLEDLVHAADH